jgi:hypothetical protein
LRDDQFAHVVDQTTLPASGVLGGGIGQARDQQARNGRTRQALGRRGLQMASTGRRQGSDDHQQFDISGGPGAQIIRGTRAAPRTIAGPCRHRRRAGCPRL